MCAKGPHEPVSALPLLEATLQLFAHSLRTPLSVISNDLYYFESQKGAAEVAASREKTEQLSQLLLHIAPAQLPETLALLKARLDPLGAALDVVETLKNVEPGGTDLAQCLAPEQVCIERALAYTLHFLLLASVQRQRSPAKDAASASHAITSSGPRLVRLELERGACRCLRLVYREPLGRGNARFEDLLELAPTNFHLRFAALNAAVAEQQLQIEGNELLVKGAM